MHYDPVWRVDCADGPGTSEKRFRWEDTGRVRVCPTNPDPYPTGVLLESIRTTLAEFKLPLGADLAAPLTRQKVRDLLAKSATAGAIDCCSFLRNLNQCRRENQDLLAVMIISFDGRQYRLFDSLCNLEEPAEWGFADDGGLILLRLVRGQPLANLVRHEMGHLLGVGGHHTGCVMDWACSEGRFCNECLRTIQRTCRVVAVKD
jgi:hypothetical protein